MCFFPPTQWFHGLNPWAKELSTNTCDVGLTSTRAKKLPPLETIKKAQPTWVPMIFFSGKNPTKGRFGGFWGSSNKNEGSSNAPGFPPEIQQNRDHLPSNFQPLHFPRKNFREGGKEQLGLFSSQIPKIDPESRSGWIWWPGDGSHFYPGFKGFVS